MIRARALPALLLWSIVASSAACAGLLSDGKPQPEAITGDQRENFLYGSIGAEGMAGLPYWIVVVLPRIFPEHLPGPGGYASLGLSWEAGKEFPAGFSKKTVVVPRVGFNCAICHSTQYRVAPDADPKVVPAGGSHRTNLQGLLEFFSRAAADPRFNADRILTEIDVAYPLPWYQRLLYRWLLIPLTRKSLAEQGQTLAWTQGRPRWGPGRDASVNLAKFGLLGLPDDKSVDHTKFPAIWTLAAREQPGRVYAEGGRVTADTMLMGLDGSSTSFRTQEIDSALGLGSRDTPLFRRRMPELLDWLRTFRPPEYPFAIDEAKANRGKTVFDAACAACHAPNQPNRLGTVIPIEEIRTDPNRLNAWTRTAADLANQKVAELGIVRSPLIKTQGYVAVHLDGLWLRAPYLHNGSVPTIRALLERGDKRPRAFCRGYDVVDPVNLGFISDERIDRRCAESGPPARPSLWDRPGSAGRSDEWPQPGIWKHDTSELGNGNEGHEYGVDLSEADKDALIEYLKRL